MTTVSDPNRFAALSISAPRRTAACSVVPACTTAEPKGVIFEVVGSPAKEVWKSCVPPERLDRSEQPARTTQHTTRPTTTSAGEPCCPPVESQLWPACYLGRQPTQPTQLNKMDSYKTLHTYLVRPFPLRPVPRPPVPLCSPSKKTAF